MAETRSRLPNNTYLGGIAFETGRHVGDESGLEEGKQSSVAFGDNLGDNLGGCDRMRTRRPVCVISKFPFRRSSFERMYNCFTLPGSWQ